MLGVVSVDYAIRRTQQTTSLKNLLVLQTSAMMFNINKSAMYATGNESDVGVFELEADRTLCIRLNDPDGQVTVDLSDDIWRCYSRDVNQLKMCDNLVAPARCTNQAGMTVLGTVVNPTGFQIHVENSSSFYLEVTLTSRADPTNPANPLTNPEYSLTTRAIPFAHTY